MYLNQEQLAELLGVAKNTIRKYEISDRVPKKCSIGKWQKVLNCSKQDISKAFTYHTLKNIEKKGCDIRHLLQAQ